MSVQIEVPLFLRYLTNSPRVNINGGTVGECLRNFVKQFPATEDLLFDKDGKLLGYLDIYVNGKSAFPEELTKQVNDGDEISILYLISGG